MTLALVLTLALTPALRAASADDVAIGFVCEPVEARIGQPVELAVVVRHPRGASVRIDGDPFAPAESAEERPPTASPWVVAADRTLRVLADPDDPTRAVTRVVWEAFALEPGELAPGPVRVEVETDARVLSRTVPGPTLTVLAELAEGEDAPRPLAGFRPPPEDVRARTRPLSLAVATLAVLAIAVVLLRARGKRAPPPAGALPAERLARIETRYEERRADDPAAAAELAYAVSALVRAEVDRRRGEELAALADDAWLERVERDARLAGATREELAALVTELEPLKYGAAHPTTFAIQALRDRAGRVLAGLDRPDGTGSAELEEGRAA